MEVKDDPLFHDASFTFSPGVHVVYGLNKAKPRSKNGNGAGKTYFFSRLSDVLFDQNKVKVGTKTINIRIGKSDYAFTRKGTKLSILRDGQSFLKSQRDMKNWMKAKFLQQSSDIYLDSRRHHPLVLGTPTERKAFLSSFFKLDQIDVEKKLIKKALDELSVIKSRRDELENALSSVAYDPKAINQLKSKVALYSEKLDRLSSLWEREREYSRISDFAKTARPSLELLGLDLPLDVAALKDIGKKLKHKSASLEQLVGHAQAYLTYKDSIAAYKKTMASISRKSLRFLESKGLEYLSKKAEEYRTLERELDRLDLDKPKTLEQVDDPKVDLKKALAKLSTVLHELDHAKEFGKGVCPTCGHKVKARSVKDVAKDIQFWKAKVKAGEQYQEYLLDKKAYSEELKNYKKARSKYRNLMAQKEELAKYVQAYEEVRNLPEKPAKYKGLKVELEDVMNQRRLLEKKLSAYRVLREGATLLRKKVKKPKRQVAPAMERAQAALADAQARLDLMRENRHKHKELVSRLKEYEAQLVDEPDLKELYNAYADKAVKRMIVQRIGSLLAAQINKYASKFMPEDFRFDLVWNSTNIEFLVHRRYGKKVTTTDVRELSGAESKLFTYIVIMALMTFTPAHLRSSLIILDEPATNMHPETAASFKNFVKALNKIVPTIVIITPQPDELYEGASAYTVVKKQGASRIVKGHPSNIKERT